MKSNKQKRAELKARRLERAQRVQERAAPDGDVRFADVLRDEAARAGLSVVTANQDVLLTHNSSFSALPSVYIDKPFTCRRCGEQELWTAKQQRWWYEVAGGAIESTTVECRACRLTRREAKRGELLSQQTERLHALAKLPPNEALRQELDLALESKWQGVRVTAIGVVGQWWGAHRDPQDLERLKGWVEGADGRYNAWPRVAAEAAAKGIALALRDHDLSWALDWFMSSGGRATRALIVRRLPQDQLLQALASPDLRRAAHVDVERAATLLPILAAADCSSPSWAALAQHYMASPVIGKLATQQLQWQWRWLQQRTKPAS